MVGAVPVRQQPFRMVNPSCPFTRNEFMIMGT